MGKFAFGATFLISKFCEAMLTLPVYQIAVQISSSNCLNCCISLANDFRIFLKVQLLLFIPLDPFSESLLLLLTLFKTELQVSNWNRSSHTSKLLLLHQKPGLVPYLTSFPKTGFPHSPFKAVFNIFPSSCFPSSLSFSADLLIKCRHISFETAARCKTTAQILISITQL